MLVRFPYQFGGGFGKVITALFEYFTDQRILDHVGDAVGAEQVDVIHLCNILLDMVI